MEGVESVTQLDDTHLHWVAEIGGVRREWDAEITEQHPDERVAWTSTDGTSNAGVVTFHRLDDDDDPGHAPARLRARGLVEKAGDALGFVARRAGRPGAVQGVRSRPGGAVEPALAGRRRRRAERADDDRGGDPSGDREAHRRPDGVDDATVAACGKVERGARVGRAGAGPPVRLPPDDGPRRLHARTRPSTQLGEAGHDRAGRLRQRRDRPQRARRAMDVPDGRGVRRRLLRRCTPRRRIRDDSWRSAARLRGRAQGAARTRGRPGHEARPPAR